MKSNLPPRLGMIDALGAGLSQASRRPWLWVFPAIIDLVLWLAPRLSVEELGTRLIQTWKALLPMVYSPTQISAMSDVINYAQETVAALGKTVNLLGVLTFGWLAPPSAFAGWQPTRFTLISDGVLAPLGLGIALPQSAVPQLWSKPVEIRSVTVMLLILLAVWVVGQVITGLFYRSAALGLLPVSAVVSTTGPASQRAGRLPRRDDAAAAPQVEKREPVNPPPLGSLVLRVALLSIVAAASAFFLTLPLALVGLFAQVAGGGGSALLLALSGGVTLWLLLWFLSALFFVGDLLVLEGASLWTSMFQSLVFVRASGFRTIIFAALVNVIMLGARALWALIATNPVGVLVAILLNAILATGMLLSIFVYYRSLRHYWLAVHAMSRQQVK